jgi:hypothetical protein
MRRLLFACRVAREAQLWGPALILARACFGDKAFGETAALMAGAYVAEGTPLSTLLHTLAGCQQALLPPPGQQGAKADSAGDAPKSSGPASGGGFSLGAFLSGSAAQASATHLNPSMSQRFPCAACEP